MINGSEYYPDKWLALNVRLLDQMIVRRDTGGSWTARIPGMTNVVGNGSSEAEAMGNFIILCIADAPNILRRYGIQV